MTASPWARTRPGWCRSSLWKSLSTRCVVRESNSGHQLLLPPALTGVPDHAGRRKQPWLPRPAQRRRGVHRGRGGIGPGERHVDAVILSTGESSAAILLNPPLNPMADPYRS